MDSLSGTIDARTLVYRHPSTMTPSPSIIRHDSLSPQKQLSINRIGSGLQLSTNWDAIVNERPLTIRPASDTSLYNYFAHQHKLSQPEGIASGFAPFVKPQHEEAKSKPILPDNPTNGDDFVPYYAAHDVTFTTLRHVIFDLQVKSATPIAHIMRERLSDTDICGLIEHYTKLKNEKSKQGEVRSKNLQRLFVQIHKAQLVHAIRLRDASMEDVDVMYFGTEATVGCFKKDMSAIRDAGGKLYHLWRQDQDPKNIGMSVIVRSGTLAELYPLARQGSESITITTNTQQAPWDAQLPESPYTKPCGIVFPYAVPIVAPELQTSTNEVDVRERNEAIDNSIQQICIGRGRSASIKALRAARKAPLHGFSKWEFTGQVFTSFAVPDNCEWWENDLKAIVKDLANDETGHSNEEDERAIVEASPRYPEPSMPLQQAIRTVEGVPFDGTRRTHNLDRPHVWWNEPLAPPHGSDLEAEHQEAEEHYNKDIADAHYHRCHLERVREQAKTSPENHSYQVRLRGTQVRQIAMDKQVEQSRSRLLELRRQLLRQSLVGSGPMKVAARSPSPRSLYSSEPGCSESIYHAPRERNSPQPESGTTDNCTRLEIDAFKSEQSTTVAKAMENGAKSRESKIELPRSVDDISHLVDELQERASLSRESEGPPSNTQASARCRYRSLLSSGSTLEDPATPATPLEGMGTTEARTKGEDVEQSSWSCEDDTTVRPWTVAPSDMLFEAE